MSDLTALIAADTRVKTASGDLLSLLTSKSKYTDKTPAATVAKNAAAILAAETELHAAHVDFEALLAGAVPPPGVTLESLKAGEDAILSALTRQQAAIDALAAKGGPATPAPAPVPTPTATPAPAPTSTLAPIPAFKNSWWDGSLADPSGNSLPWQAAEWSEGGYHAYNAFFDHVVRDPATQAVDLLLSDHGESTLTRVRQYLDVAYLMDVTLPKLVDGMIAAPIFTYNQANGDEIDFEFLKFGLQLSVKRQGVDVFQQRPAAFQGDQSGKRYTLGLVHRLSDPANAYVSFQIDGVEIARCTRANASGPLPDTAMNAVAEFWAYPNSGGWTGPWTPPPAGQPYKMRLHGYAEQVF